MGGCQNYGPFLGTLNIRCRIIIGIQKRDDNFDNHPHVTQLTVELRADVSLLSTSFLSLVLAETCRDPMVISKA